MRVDQRRGGRARCGGRPEGLLLAADQQTRGRGRRGRAWHSPCGGEPLLLAAPASHPRRGASGAARSGGRIGAGSCPGGAGARVPPATQMAERFLLDGAKARARSRASWPKWPASAARSATSYWASGSTSTHAALPPIRRPGHLAGAGRGPVSGSSVRPDQLSCRLRTALPGIRGPRAGRGARALAPLRPVRPTLPDRARRRRS